MKKESLLLLLKGSAGEMDWILPVISKLSKNFNVYTFFRSKKAFKILEENPSLFKKWNKINKNYYVDNIYRGFVWKLFRKISIKLNLKNLVNNLDIKIHNIEFLKKKFLNYQNEKNFFKYIFSEYNYPNSWYESAKYKKDKSLIIHYPHSPWITFFKKDYKNNYKLNGDILLLNSQYDKKRWNKFIEKKKIFEFGIPKYDPKWIKELIKFERKIIKKNKFIITIPYKSFFNIYPDKKDILENYFSRMINGILDNNQNCIILIKLHPRLKCKYTEIMILNLKKKFKNRIILTKTNLIYLAKISNLFLCPTNTATIFDSIYFKTPTLQYDVGIKMLDGKENYNNVYERKKISIIFKDLTLLNKNINNLISKKIDLRFKYQQKQFQKFFKYKNSIYNIVSFLKEKYDEKFEII